MRRRLPFAVLLALLGLGVVPAQAEHQRIAARNFFFKPETKTVDIDQRVEWYNADRNEHNVWFPDGAYEEPDFPTPGTWRVGRSFATPGRYDYYCRAHWPAMGGTIVVRERDSTPANLTDPGPGPDRTAPRFGGLRAGGRPYCKRRGRNCTITVRFTLSEDARVSGTVLVTRGGRSRRFGRLSITGRAGLNAFGFHRATNRRAVRPGRYRITLRATDRAGNRSGPRTLRVLVAP